MRVCRWENGTAERTVIRSCGISRCNAFNIGAVCATWPKPWPEMETTRWGALRIKGSDELRRDYPR